MDFPRFALFTLLGSIPWTFTLAFLGFKLGDKIDQVSQLSNVFHGLDVVIIVVVLALVGLYIHRHIQRDRAAEQAEALRGERIQP